MLSLSFIPYATSYAAEKHFDSFSTLLYNVAMVSAGAVFFGLRHTAMRLQQRHGDLDKSHKVEAKKHLISLGIYCLAIPLALVHPLLAFALNKVVTLLWIVPDLGIRRPFEAETTAQ